MRYLVVGWLGCALLLAGCLPQEQEKNHKASKVVTTVALMPPQDVPVFTVSGLINRTNVADTAVFDWPMLHDLPHHTLKTHTSVTDGRHRFEGVLMRDLLAHVGAQGDVVELTALNDYRVRVPVADFHHYDVIAAWSMDGQPLTPSDKGPLWIVYPRDQYKKLRDIRYDYRWIWQLVRMDVQ